MANIATERIMREFKAFAECDIKVESINDNYTELKGIIAGPPGTPYEGGDFILQIKVPETYPFNPPKVRFVTKIWHPNISFVTGAICLNKLTDQWAASMTIHSLLIWLQTLLSAADEDHPEDAIVAKQFKEDFEMFQLTARHWTYAYAGGANMNKEFDDKIKKLAGIGVVEYQARVTLSSHNWDIKRATEEFLK